MDVSLFDFNLPEVAIALRPASPRDSAKLLQVSPEGRLSTPVDDNTWRAFVRPAKRLKIGDTLSFSDTLTALVSDKKDGGDVCLKFSHRDDLLVEFNRAGEPPLPPYIARKRTPDAKDVEDYQTVYANEAGSVAAPTAGLHFTESVFEDLAKKGDQSFILLMA